MCACCIYIAYMRQSPVLAREKQRAASSLSPMVPADAISTTYYSPEALYIKCALSMPWAACAYLRYAHPRRQIFQPPAPRWSRGTASRLLLPCPSFRTPEVLLDTQARAGVDRAPARRHRLRPAPAFSNPARA
eukprot:scaffold53580_cov65-Phaeocystis_antarctica.AAC.6